ncbi:hypothetical protein [Pelomonas sp. Root1237]|uniref:hypothetical protein n=1 Tax=Pelomonas sp. Root1237 TaxID=1736434 RepID=UPI0006F6F5A2|nr:hypothetical protein [Pelomonas sp. Root1237]KQV96590.1 hypothetical protein ASC91_03340 [Pelomonas sp. Root1237]
MKFVDTAINKTERYSIGKEVESGRFYLAIPVSNRLVDYEEYYQIDATAHERYPANSTQLGAFADECRARKHDNLLFIPPGKERGYAT